MDYRKYLLEDILPFWLKASIDNEFGGIMNQVDKYGNVYETEKNAWFIGRALWSYSMAYRIVEPKEEYLVACEKLFSFFEKCTLDGDRLPHMMTREGEAKTVREIYYYSEMFAAMGCAQYYRICKKPEVWERAERYFDTVYELYLKNRYSTQEIGFDVACKTFGLHMATLATAQFMRNVGINEGKYNAVIDLAIAEMFYGGYVDDENRCVREYLTMSGELLDNKFRNSSCPGHILEAGWFVLCEGEYRNDDGIRNFGKKLCDYAMPDGFEKKVRFIPTMSNVEIHPCGDQTKTYIWWPQCEAVVAYRVLYNIYGEEKYLLLSNEIEKEAFRIFADFENGEWYGEITADGKPVSENKGSVIKGPFHIPRMLFALISLEEGGNIMKYIG